MTTIVITDQHIAADRQRTYGEQSGLHPDPKIMFTKDAVFGLCGEPGPALHILRAVAKGSTFLEAIETLKVTSDHEWFVVMITKQDLKHQRCRVFDNEDPWGRADIIPNAFGSGAAYALGALAMVIDAERACKVAQVYDIHSGHGTDVQSFAKLVEMMDNARPDTLYDLWGYPIAGSGRDHLDFQARRD